MRIHILTACFPSNTPSPLLTDEGGAQGLEVALGRGVPLDKNVLALLRDGAQVLRVKEQHTCARTRPGRAEALSLAH